MKRWLLLYETAADYIDRRAPLREEHLKLVKEAHERGDLELAGAYGAGFDNLRPDISGALLVWRGDDGRAKAEEFAKNDPYVTNGLITKWHVHQWMVVVGS